MSSAQPERSSQNNAAPGRPFRLWLYLFIVFILSWPFQVISVLGPSTLSWAAIFNSASMIAVGVGTFICGRYVFRDSFPGAGWRWPTRRAWLAALGIPAALWVVPALIDLALGNLHLPKTFSWTKLAWVCELLFVVLIPAFGEEIGWRGYMLPRMARRMSPRKAVIWHSLIWYVWHWPLVAAGAFLMMKHQMPGSHFLAVILVTAVALAAGSVLAIFLGAIFAAVWGWTRSIVAVTVLHAAYDGFRDSLSITVGSGPVGAVWTPALTFLLGLLFLWKFGWTRLNPPTPPNNTL